MKTEMPKITREMLRDYLHDALPDEELTAIEATLRSSKEVQAMLASVREEIDRGEHSIGGIWRRERLSCPTRDAIGSYLLQAVDEDVSAYIEFHLKTIGCPACQANHDDLSKKKAATGTTKRRQKLIEQTSHSLKKAGKK